jgi:hypothetical protein
MRLLRTKSAAFAIGCATTVAVFGIIGAVSPRSQPGDQAELGDAATLPTIIDDTISDEALALVALYEAEWRALLHYSIYSKNSAYRTYIDDYWDLILHYATQADFLAVEQSYRQRKKAENPEYAGSRKLLLEAINAVRATRPLLLRELLKGPLGVDASLHERIDNAFPVPEAQP